MKFDRSNTTLSSIRRELEQLTNSELMHRLHQAATRCQKAMVVLLLHLAEVDRRRLHLERAKSSLFRYCTDILGMPEGAAYRRIYAARQARRFPLILERIANGRLHLAGVKLLGPHLTDTNHRELLDAAGGKTKRAIEQLVAERFPRPDTPDLIRKLPLRTEPAQQQILKEVRSVRQTDESSQTTEAKQPGSAEKAGAPLVNPLGLPEKRIPNIRVQANTSRPTEQLQPLSAQKVKISFTAHRKTADKLAQIRALLSHKQPNASLASIVDEALTLYREQLLKQRFAVGAKSRNQAISPRKAAGKPTTGKSKSQIGGKSTSDQAGQPTNSANQPKSPLKKRGPKRKTTGSGPRSHSGKIHKQGNHDSRPNPAGPGTCSPSRHIPNEIKRQVIARDGLRCSFVGSDGQRCSETHFLEYHHIKPWAWSKQHSAESITLYCRAHNQYQARLDFGTG